MESDDKKCQRKKCMMTHIVHIVIYNVKKQEAV